MNKTFLISLIVAILVVAGLAFWQNGKPDERLIARTAFAECLRESGTTFFGAFWCPACQQQKQLFGKAEKDLPYVECSTSDGEGQTQECIDEQIGNYPTWEFADGSRQTGVVQLADLAAASGCTLPDV